MLSPLVAGQLADLPGKYPEKFGHVGFLKQYPYAPPALLNGSILLISLLAVFFFLEEVGVAHPSMACKTSPSLTRGL